MTIGCLIFRVATDERDWSRPVATDFGIGRGWSQLIGSAHRSPPIAPEKSGIQGIGLCTDPD
eukprot:932690-Pyramimonas_sp.AAC.1